MGVASFSLCWEKVARQTTCEGMRSTVEHDTVWRLNKRSYDMFGTVYWVIRYPGFFKSHISGLAGFWSFVYSQTQLYWCHWINAEHAVDSLTGEMMGRSKDQAPGVWDNEKSKRNDWNPQANDPVNYIFSCYRRMLYEKARNKNLSQLMNPLFIIWFLQYALFFY